MSSDKKLDAVRQMLLERKRLLEEKLTELSKEKVVDDGGQDPGDQALSSTMESLKLSLQDTERQEYDRIVRALGKIDDGSYGICADCGLAISEKRLNLNPNVSRCLACQEAYEDTVRG